MRFCCVSAAFLAGMKMEQEMGIFFSDTLYFSYLYTMYHMFTMHFNRLQPGNITSYQV